MKRNLLNAVLAAVILLASLVQAQQLPPPTLSEKAQPSTVYIYYKYADANGGLKDESGSGFIVSPSGFVLTSEHVISRWRNQIDTERAKRPLFAKIASINSANPVQLQLVDWDEKADIALLKLRDPTKTYPALTLCFVGDLPAGTEIYAFGFPYDKEFTPFKGEIANRDGPAARWSANVNFADGASGGPVFNAKSQQVIGIVKGGYGDVSAIRYVTQVERAKVMLQKQGIGDNCTGAPRINDGSIAGGAGSKDLRRPDSQPKSADQILPFRFGTSLDKYYGNNAAGLKAEQIASGMWNVSYTHQYMGMPFIAYQEFDTQRRGGRARLERNFSFPKNYQGEYQSAIDQYCSVQMMIRTFVPTFGVPTSTSPRVNKMNQDIGFTQSQQAAWRFQDLSQIIVKVDFVGKPESYCVVNLCAVPSEGASCFE